MKAPDWPDVLRAFSRLHAHQAATGALTSERAASATNDALRALAGDFGPARSAIEASVTLLRFAPDAGVPLAAIIRGGVAEGEHLAASGLEVANA